MMIGMKRKGESSLDEVIDAMNVALNAADWAEVVRLAPLLYQIAMEAGDEQLADLVQDMQSIAQDALAHPLVPADVFGVLA